MTVKGFPNQVADLRKLADGLAVIRGLNKEGKDPKSNDTLGEALVRAKVWRLAILILPSPLSNTSTNSEQNAHPIRATRRGLAAYVSSTGSLVLSMTAAMA